VSQSVDSVFCKFQILFFIFTKIIHLCYCDCMLMYRPCKKYVLGSLLLPNNLALDFLSLLIWIFMLLWYASVDPVCLVSLGTLSRIWFFF
jgi:hypothetical protein